MPHLVLDPDIEWVGSLSWYDDYFLVKTSSHFQIVKLSNSALQISSSSLKDAGNEDTLQIQLRSRYCPAYNFTLKIIYLELNSLDAIYLSSNFSLYLYPDLDQSYPVSRFIQGPNMRIKLLTP